MILDATAGNRTMWKTKQADAIVYIDMEKRLTVKPTIFADNTQTPFMPKTFTAIFYDPPHGVGWQPPYSNIEVCKAKRKELTNKYFETRYYGWDKYTTYNQLITHIWRAQKEFHRILTDDGTLWLKWNETRLPLNRILRIFDEWIILMEILQSPEKHTLGKAKTYWIVLTKKGRKLGQTSLFDA